MVFFKDYSFEYNAKQSDVFKSIVVCSYAYEVDDFKEGSLLDIETASFYGIITESKNTGQKLQLSITAESYARELRNNSITTETSFRQVEAIQIIKDYLLPEDWAFEYPEILDTYPRYISYILRNGTFLSHISTILQILGLDFTVYTTLSGGIYTKTVKAFFRDSIEDQGYTAVKEYEQFANFTTTVNYGKIATSVIVMPAESELGINQVTMDAEILDWDNAPYLYQIKDVSMSKPEFSDTSPYFWYFPASPDDYTIGLLSAGDRIVIDTEPMKIKSIWFLPANRVASYESGALTDDGLPAVLQSIATYNKTGVIVASVELNATFWSESVQANITNVDNRSLSPYGSESVIHAIYDDVLLLSAQITVSSYLTFGKNLPSSNGFAWFGSERIFYRSCTDNGSTYTLNSMIRGVPTCASADCEHCGTRPEMRDTYQIGWTYGCPFANSDHGIAGQDMSIGCTLLASIKTAFGYPSTVDGNLYVCPLCFDGESVCPITKCPFIDDVWFPILCPRGIKREDVIWTDKYQHHKDSIVFPASYYYSDNDSDVYEAYARDSLISKHGYIPTQISVKGVSDQDGLDKAAAGYLRLSALPTSGKFTYFNYNTWSIPQGLFPGDVIEVSVASRSQYNFGDQLWYPTQWFDTSSNDKSADDGWQHVALSGDIQWVQTKKKFVIQKSIKLQRGLPEIYFGTTNTEFQDVMEYLADVKDTTSQRHRNQDMTLIINSSETGIAAKVKSIKTGKETWVRMVR